MQTSTVPSRFAPEFNFTNILESKQDRPVAFLSETHLHEHLGVEARANGHRPVAFRSINSVLPSSTGPRQRELFRRFWLINSVLPSFAVALEPKQSPTRTVPSLFAHEFSSSILHCPLRTETTANEDSVPSLFAHEFSSSVLHGPLRPETTANGDCPVNSAPAPSETVGKLSTRQKHHQKPSFCCQFSTGAHMQQCFNPRLL